MTDLTEAYLVRLMRKMVRKNRSACAGGGTDGQAWRRSVAWDARDPLTPTLARHQNAATARRRPASLSHLLSGRCAATTSRASSLPSLRYPVTSALPPLLPRDLQKWPARVRLVSHRAGAPIQTAYEMRSGVLWACTKWIERVLRTSVNAWRQAKKSSRSEGKEMKDGVKGGQPQAMP